MICVACRVKRHEDCPGGTWCDCQHQPAAVGEAGAEERAHEAGRDPDLAQANEPAMNWIHQG
jgi:hypothetical protein